MARAPCAQLLPDSIEVKGHRGEIFVLWSCMRHPLSADAERLRLELSLEIPGDIRVGMCYQRFRGTSEWVK